MRVSRKYATKKTVKIQYIYLVDRKVLLEYFIYLAPVRDAKVLGLDLFLCLVWKNILVVQVIRVIPSDPVYPVDPM